MKTSIIALIGENFNGTSTDTGCCDMLVENESKCFLGQGEAGGHFGSLYVYTAEAEEASEVEEELISGGATILGKITGSTNVFVG